MTHFIPALPGFNLLSLTEDSTTPADSLVTSAPIVGWRIDDEDGIAVPVTATSMHTRTVQQMLDGDRAGIEFPNGGVDAPGLCATYENRAEWIAGVIAARRSQALTAAA